MRTANLKEWVGKTDDSRPPRHVRARIFEAHGGICHLSKVKIDAGRGDKWDLDHIVAICNGGENRETNLAPALVASHKAKTRQDRKTKAKNDHVRMKHIGVQKPRTMTRWRKFDGTPVFAARQR